MNRTRLYLYAIAIVLSLTMTPCLYGQGGSGDLPEKKSHSKTDKRKASTTKKKTQSKQATETSEQGENENTPSDKDKNAPADANKSAPNDVNNNAQTDKDKKSEKDAELLYWSSIVNEKNPAYFRSYLEKFPNGLYSEIARLKIQELEEYQRKTNELKNNEPIKSEEITTTSDAKTEKSKSDEVAKTEAAPKADAPKQDEDKKVEDATKTDEPKIAPSSENKALVNAETTVNPEAKPLKVVSGGVLNGKATSLPKPNYPASAMRARVQGMVVVEVLIDETGKVVSAKAISGPDMLRQAAEQAALQAKFSPTLLSGEAIRVKGEVKYTFSLM